MNTVSTFRCTRPLGVQLDLIGGLSQAMGIDSKAATALAGAVMGNISAQAEDNDDADAKAQVEQAVPEMGGWLQAAADFASGDSDDAKEDDGVMGGLMGMASSGLGNQLLGAVAGKEAQNAALLGGVLQKIGLDNNQAMMAAPVVIQFLKTRMDAEWVERIMKIVPILSGQEDAPKEEPSVLGALGSLFGS